MGAVARTQTGVVVPITMGRRRHDGARLYAVEQHRVDTARRRAEQKREHETAEFVGALLMAFSLVVSIGLLRWGFDLAKWAGLFS